MDYDAPMPRALVLTCVVVGSACGPSVVRVPMTAENNSGQSGFALLTPLSGATTRVELELSPGNDPRPQAAHVHEGRCGEIGPIKAPLMDLVATPAKGGRFSSSTDINVGVAELLRGTFAINVHDARDFSLYVACGELK